MKLEQPVDLFTADNFLTSENSAVKGNLAKEEALLSAAKNMPTFNPNVIPTDSVGSMHTETQELTATQKQQLNTQFSREILAEERAQMAVQSFKNSKVGEKVPLAKDVFSDIITMGQYSEVVKVAKHEWIIRALEQSDILCAADDVRDNSDGQLGYLTSFNFAKLVYAIEGIDGYSIYDLFPDIVAQTFKDKISYISAVKRALRAYMLAFPVSIVDELIQEQLRIEQVRDDKVTRLKNS